MTWAPGAKPAGDSGGPDTVTHDVRVLGRTTAAHTRTITTTTAAGTSAAASTTTVLDLVTTQPVRTVDPLGRVTSYTYDAGGRQTSKTTPDGLTTRTSYTAATPATSTAPATPATRTDSTSDGRVVLTTYDALGRTARVTDNVSQRGVHRVPDGPAVVGVQLQPGRRRPPPRPISRAAPSPPRWTCSAGRCRRSTRPVSPTPPPTTTWPTPSPRRSTPAGSTSPVATRTTTYDNGNQPVTVHRQYSDGTADPTQLAGYDGLGRVTSQTSNDLTLGYTYLGAGGASTRANRDPARPAPFPAPR